MEYQKNRISRSVVLILILFMALSFGLFCSGMQVHAKSASGASGKNVRWCGKNVKWTLNNTGVLTISGKGSVKNYNNDNNQSPWFGNDYIKSVNVKSGVTGIGNSAFVLCDRVTDVTLPSTLKRIGVDAFHSCAGLQKITIPGGTTTIGDGAFCYCTKLNSVTLPGTLTSIGDDAFYDSSLKTITIPKKVKSIGKYALGYRDNAYHNGEKKVSGFTIKGYPNTAAEKYAKNNGFKFLYIKKAANTLKIKAKTATVRYANLKKKNQTLKNTKLISFTKKGQGTITYTKVSGNKKITINKKTGKVTVKKGLKKGTYKIKIKVRAAGNAKYKALTKTVIIKIKVI